MFPRNWTCRQEMRQGARSMRYARCFSRLTSRLGRQLNSMFFIVPEQTERIGDRHFAGRRSSGFSSRACRGGRPAITEQWRRPATSGAGRCAGARGCVLKGDE